MGNAGDWWASYYPPDNMQRPTGPTCDGCHSVGYDIHTKQVAEWNVGCERCHGPGSEHVVRRTRNSIVNPARMDAVAANDTCIQCHSQGRPREIPLEGKYYDWPVGYRVGVKLADYWQLEDREARRDGLLLLRGWHGPQESDARQRFLAEPHVPARHHLFRLPRCPRHGQLRAAHQAGQYSLPRLPRPFIAERTAHHQYLKRTRTTEPTAPEVSVWRATCQRLKPRACRVPTSTRIRSR